MSEDFCVPRGMNWDEAKALEKALTATAVPDDSVPDENAKPWDALTRHDDLNEFISSRGIEEPEGWDKLTINQKKEWLSENFE